MKIVATTDWHMDRSTSGFNRFDDVEAAVVESVNLAIEQKADAYLMLGDLADPGSRLSYRAIQFAIAVGRQMEAAGVRVAFVPGNHDVIETGFGDHVMLPLIGAGLTVLDRPGATMLGKLPVVALPFTPASHTYDPAEAIPRRGNPGAVLVVGHLCAEGAEHGSETEDMPRGRDVFWPTAEVRTRIRGAVMVGGHYHRRQVVDGVNMIGALERLTHGEESNRPGFFVLEV